MNEPKKLTSIEKLAKDCIDATADLENIERRMGILQKELTDANDNYIEARQKFRECFKDSASFTVVVGKKILTLKSGLIQVWDTSQ